MSDYETVRKELSEFKVELGSKREIVLLTKTDMVSPKEVEKLITKLKKKVKAILPVSIHDFQSLEELKKVLKNI